MLATKYMKIAFLNVYQASVNRGMERFVKEISSRLSKKHQVKIIGIDRDFERKINWSKKESTGSLARRFFLDYWSLLIAKYTLSQLKEILNGDYDIVIPLNGGWQSLLVKIASLYKGFRVLIPGQSGKGWDDRTNLLTFPNVFVALSTNAVYWAKKVNPLVKSVYIPNGVDLNKFYPRKDEKGIHGAKTILAVGAFTKQKRLDLTIKAVAPISDAKLLLVGGRGDLKSELSDLGEKMLGKERFEMKTLSLEKMPDVYRSADVFTLPSASSEAFGNVLVEAMASGLPVVATDDPTRREIVGDAGLFVDPTDTDDYTKKLRSAMDTDWKLKPRTQAEKFDWDEIAVKYERIFQELTKK